MLFLCFWTLFSRIRYGSNLLIITYTLLCNMYTPGTTTWGCRFV